MWAERLSLASESARTEGRWLASETDGPLVEPMRLAGWDTWRGSTGDHFRGLMLELTRRHLDPLAEQVLRCAHALAQLQQQAEQALAGERAGLAPVGFDVEAGLRPWRSWTPTSAALLAAGWNRPPRGRSVFMDVVAVHRLAGSLLDSADALRTSRLRLQAGFDHVGLEPPPLLVALEAATVELGNEIRRRGDMMEAADAQVAGLISSFKFASFTPRPFLEGLTTAPAAHRTKTEWQLQAMQRAGIDPATWDPKKGMAHNRKTVNAVYDYYGDMYEADPVRFRWMGMARLVGAPLVAAFQDLCALRRHTERGRWAAPALPMPVAVLLTLSPGELKFFETTLLTMQKDIFMNIAWQHEAFLAGGLPEIERQIEAGTIKPAGPMKAAWRNIASGDPAKVAKGTKEMVRLEQQDVIQKNYTKMRRHHEPVGQGVMWMFSRMAGDPPPIPGGKPFCDVVAVSHAPDLTPDWMPERLIPGKDGDVSEWSDRKKWVNGNLLPAYERFLKEQPDEMARMVATPVAERAGDLRRIPGRCS